MLQKRMSGISTFVLYLSKSDNDLFKKMRNGIYLFSSAASVIAIGKWDNTLVHELWVIAAVELHVNPTYYAQYPALKSVYGKDQSVLLCLVSYFPALLHIRTLPPGLKEKSKNSRGFSEKFVLNPPSPLFVFFLE